MIFVSWSITRGAYYTVNFVNNLQQFGNIFVCFFRKYSCEIGILGVVYWGSPQTGVLVFCTPPLKRPYDKIHF